MATKRALANYGGVRREMADTDTLPKINLQELIIGTITAGITDQSPSSASVFTALAGKVNTTGNETIAGLKTFTSEIRAYNAGAGPGLVALCADEGFVADLIHARGTDVRWRHRMKSDAGADFQMIGYSDAGAATTVFTTSRTSYVVDFKQRPTYLGTNLALTSEVVLIGADISGPGAASSFDITQGTSDGADDSRTGVAGGGSFSNTRGAYLLLNGNEYATDPGRALLTSGLNTPVRIIGAGSGNVSLESATGVVAVLAAGLYVGTQSGGGVGLLRLEGADGARAGFTDTGLRRWTIGNDGSSFSIRDESGAVDRIVVSSTGTATFDAEISITGAHTSSPLAISGSLTGSARNVSWTNTDTSTSNALALLISSGAGASGQFCVFGTEYTGIPVHAGRTVITNLTGAGISLSAETASGTIELRTTASRTLRWQAQNAGHLVPGADNSYDLGASGTAVRKVWMVDGDINGNPVGYRNVPLTTQNAAYTFVAADAGKGRMHTDTTARTYTVNNSVFAAGDVIVVLNNTGTGAVTIAAGAGVTLYLAGTTTTGNRTVAVRGHATIFMASASVGYVSGAGVT